MIYTKFTLRKTIGQYFLTAGLVFLLFLFWAFFINKHYPAYPIPVFSIEGLVGCLLTVVLPITIIYQMVVNYRTITIDEQNKTISFKAFVIGTITTYDFDYFDGYIDTVKPTKMGMIKTIYLIKDNIVKYKINTLFYENFEELKKGLRPLNYLGFKKYTLGLSLKIVFGNPIL